MKLTIIVPAYNEEAYLQSTLGDPDRGGVFTSDLIDTWISYKRSRDVDGVQLRPHPYEFMLYYDA